MFNTYEQYDSRKDIHKEFLQSMVIDLTKLISVTTVIAIAINKSTMALIKTQVILILDIWVTLLNFYMFYIRKYCMRGQQTYKVLGV